MQSISQLAVDTFILDNLTFTLNAKSIYKNVIDF